MSRNCENYDVEFDESIFAPENGFLSMEEFSGIINDDRGDGEIPSTDGYVDNGVDLELMDLIDAQNYDGYMAVITISS
jgi:hypothetical protein